MNDRSTDMPQPRESAYGSTKELLSNNIPEGYVEINLDQEHVVEHIQLGRDRMGRALLAEAFGLSYVELRRIISLQAIPFRKRTDGSSDWIFVRRLRGDIRVTYIPLNQSWKMSSDRFERLQAMEGGTRDKVIELSLFWTYMKRLSTIHLSVEKPSTTPHPLEVHELHSNPSITHPAPVHIATQESIDAVASKGRSRWSKSWF